MYAPKSERVQKFLNEIAEVCKKHGLSLSHEDEGGAFEVGTFAESDIKWLMDAVDLTDEGLLLYARQRLDAMDD